MRQQATYLLATLNDLKKVIGKPTYRRNNNSDEDDDITIGWHKTTTNGANYYIHDWRETKPISGGTEDIRWKIEADTLQTAMVAHEEIIQAIIKIS